MLDHIYVGCDASIYSGLGSADPRRQAQIIHVPEIEPVESLYPSATYRRPFSRSSLFVDEDRIPNLQGQFVDWLGGAHAEAPGVSLVRLSGATIRDRGVTVDHQGVTYPLFETYRPSDLLNLPLPGPRGPTSTLPDTHAYLLLTSAGTFNWGHWLTEDLPRLKAIAALAKHEGPVCVLLHGFVPATDKVRIALLRALTAECGASVRLLRPDTDYQANRLYFASPVSGQPGPKHPTALAELAEAGAALGKTQDATWWRPRRNRPERLFILRRSERGRVPVNLDDLSKSLRARGYSIFDPEGASGVEQVSAFASAERIVGCMGAAMVGSLFARPGTRILYLAPDSFADPYYLDLAAARNHHYGVCYGGAICKAERERSNYVLNERRLVDALDWLEAGASVDV